MDQFLVLKVYKYVSPDVVGTFADEEDALQFGALMKRSNPDYRYAVAKLIAVTK